MGRQAAHPSEEFSVAWVTEPVPAQPTNANTHTEHHHPVGELSQDTEREGDSSKRSAAAPCIISSIAIANAVLLSRLAANVNVCECVCACLPSDRVHVIMVRANHPKQRWSEQRPVPPV